MSSLVVVFPLLQPIGEEAGDGQVGGGAGIDALPFQPRIENEQMLAPKHCRRGLGHLPAQLAGVGQHGRGNHLPMLARDVAVGEGGQEVQIDGLGQRHRIGVGQQPGASDTDVEDVAVTVGILGGDAVAQAGRGHGLAQVHRRRAGNVMLRRLA